jgi:hypothetical protein
MKFALNISFLLLLILTSCSSPNRPIQSIVSIDSTASHIEADTLKSNFNGDTLKSVFSKYPYNYTFKDEMNVQETTDSSVEGYESETEYKKYVDEPNSIIINYDKNTRKATSVTFYLNHLTPSNIKIKHLEKLFSFIDFFDPDGSKYIVKNFKSLFYDEDAYDKQEPYLNKSKNLKIFVDHVLFYLRKAQRKNPNASSNQGSIDVIITFL